MQKFHRGNIVRLLHGSMIHQFSNGEDKEIDMSPEETGRLAVIEYSYSERFGSGKSEGGGYSIRFLDTGCSVAWKHDEELEFVDNGGEHVIEECIEKSESLSKQQKDITWIKNNWENLKLGISANSILTLLHKIGYNSSFERNGEYFILYDDWGVFFPMFNMLMESNLDGALNYLNGAIKQEYIVEMSSKLNDFYLELQNI